MATQQPETQTKTEIATELLQEMAATGIGAASVTLELAGQAAPLAVSQGAAAFGDAIDLVKAGKDLIQDAGQLAKQAKSEITFKMAQKDPEIQGLLAMRSYANGMLKLQNAAQDQVQQKLDNLDKMENLAASLAADPEAPIPDDLSPQDIKLLMKSPDERNQAIGQSRQMLTTQMNEMKQAAGQLDTLINAVNSNPRISSPEFRKLEAKHDLENNLGQTGLKTVRDMMNATKSGIGLAGNAIGAASTVMTIAGAGGAIATAAMGAASAGATIATGAMMVAGGTAGMAVAAYKHHELSKLQTTAGELARDTMKGAQNAEDPDRSVEMAFALTCVEEKARQDKNVEKLKVLRNAGITTAGVGSMVMGTGAIVTMAGAAGYGAGAAPGLVLTGVGGGIAAAGGAVAVGAQVGIKGYKTYQAHLEKQDVKTAKTALETQDLMIKISKTDDPAARQALEAQITPEKLAALDKMKQGLKGTLKALGVKDEVAAAQLNDASQVAKFAACVIIQRDPKMAAETIAKTALSECHGAFLKRAEGGAVAQGAKMTPGRATNIVEADLPKDAPGINALRKLGMDDRKITQTMNALASDHTRSIGNKTIQKQTGLKA